MLKKTCRKLIHKDADCRIYESTDGILHVALNFGEVIIPSPEQYAGFTARDFSDLYRELVGSGIPEKVASRWVNQGQGFDGV